MSTQGKQTAKRISVALVAVLLAVMAVFAFTQATSAYAAKGDAGDPVKNWDDLKTAIASPPGDGVIHIEGTDGMLVAEEQIKIPSGTKVTLQGDGDVTIYRQEGNADFSVFSVEGGELTLGNGITMSGLTGTCGPASSQKCLQQATFTSSEGNLWFSSTELNLNTSESWKFDLDSNGKLHTSIGGSDKYGVAEGSRVQFSSEQAVDNALELRDASGSKVTSVTNGGEYVLYLPDVGYLIKDSNGLYAGTQDASQALTFTVTGTEGDCANSAATDEFKVVWSNGASGEDKVKTETVTASAGDVLSKTPEGWAPKTGYVFKGWKWITPDGTEGSSTGGDTGFTVPEDTYGTMTIVAQWEKPGETTTTYTDWGSDLVPTPNYQWGEGRAFMIPITTNSNERSGATTLADWEKYFFNSGAYLKAGDLKPDGSTVVSDVTWSVTLTADSTTASYNNYVHDNWNPVNHPEDMENFKTMMWEFESRKEDPEGEFYYLLKNSATGKYLVIGDQISNFMGIVTNYVKLVDNPASYGNDAYWNFETGSYGTVLRTKSGKSLTTYDYNGGSSSVSNLNLRRTVPSTTSSSTGGRSIGNLRYATVSTSTSTTGTSAPTPYTSTVPSWVAQTASTPGQTCKDTGGCQSYSNDGSDGTLKFESGDADNPKGFFAEVKGGGTLTLNGAKLTDFVTDGTVKYAAPVVANGGTFNMQSGSIEHNSVGYTVDDNSKSGHSAGAIGKESEDGNYGERGYIGQWENTETAGAVIYTNNASGTISGGYVKDNRGDTGAILVQGLPDKQNDTVKATLEEGNPSNVLSKLDIKGGSIDNNVGIHHAGAIYIFNGADVVMDNGEITNNFSWNKGGAIWVSEEAYASVLWNQDPNYTGAHMKEAGYAGFTMEGGKINGNMTINRGGAINVMSNHVQLLGGEIKNNTSRVLGGAIYVEGDGTDRMYSLVVKEGCISRNTAYTQDNVINGTLNRTFNTAAEGADPCNFVNNITKNNATTEDKGIVNSPDFGGYNGYGGGMWFCSFGGNATFNVEGDINVVVDGNTAQRVGQDIHVHVLRAGSTNGINVLDLGDKNSFYIEGTNTPLAENRNYQGIVSIENTNNLTECPADSGVIIQDNQATVGGGIAANGTVIFGKDKDVYLANTSLQIEKTWDVEPPQGTEVNLKLYVKYNGQRVAISNNYDPLQGYEVVLDGTADTLVEGEPGKNQYNENSGAWEYDRYKAYMGLPLVATLEDGTKVPLMKFIINGDEKDPSVPAELEEIYKYVANGQNAKLTTSEVSGWNIEIVETINGVEQTYEMPLGEKELGNVQALPASLRDFKDRTGRVLATYGTYPLRIPFSTEIHNVGEGDAEVEKYINGKVHQTLNDFSETFEYAILAYVPKDATEVVIEDQLEAPLKFVSDTPETLLSGVYILKDNNHIGDGVNGTVVTTPKSVTGNTLAVKNGVKNRTRQGDDTTLDVDFTNNKFTLTLKEDFLQNADDAVFKIEGKDLDGVWVMVTFEAKYKDEYKDVEKLQEGGWLTVENNKQGSTVIVKPFAELALFAGGAQNVTAKQDNDRYYAKVGEDYYQYVKSTNGPWYRTYTVPDSGLTQYSKIGETDRYNGYAFENENKVEGYNTLINRFNNNTYTAVDPLLREVLAAPFNTLANVAGTIDKATEDSDRYYAKVGNDYYQYVKSTNGPWYRTDVDAAGRMTVYNKLGETAEHSGYDFETNNGLTGFFAVRDNKINGTAITITAPGSTEVNYPVINGEDTNAKGQHQGTANQGTYTVTQGNRGTSTYTTNIVTVDVEEPEIEKYVSMATDAAGELTNTDADVHQELEYFDRPFRYDIMAYVPSDADTVTITDELDKLVTFRVNEKGNVEDANGNKYLITVTDMGTDNDHTAKGTVSAQIVDGQEYPKAIEVGSTAKEEDADKAAQVEVEDGSLKVTIENRFGLDANDNPDYSKPIDGKQYASDLRGHWVRVSFEAVLDSAKYQDILDTILKDEFTETELVGWKIVDKDVVLAEDEGDSRKDAKKGNDPVITRINKHEGAANKSSYEVGVLNNDATAIAKKYDDSSNTVTVKPEAEKVWAQKEWQDEDATFWPDGVTVTVNVTNPSDVGNKFETKIVLTEPGKKATDKELPKFSTPWEVTEEAISGYRQVGDATGTGTEDDPFVIKNKKATTDLTIEKETVGNKEGEFEFRIKAWTEEQDVYEEIGVYTGRGATPEIPDSGPIPIKTLSVNASASDLPLGTIRGTYTLNRLTTGYQAFRITAANTTISGPDINVTDRKFDSSTNTLTFTADVTAANASIKVESTNRMTDTEAYNTQASLKLERQVSAASTTYLDLSRYDDRFSPTDTEGVYSVTIKNGESITIAELPAGCHYEVSEITPAGWQLVSVNDDENKTSAEGTLEENQEAKATFLNEKHEPEIAKYVNKNVHADIVYFDKEFTYDILAYITKDADSAKITDTLDSALVFKDGNNTKVIISDLGTDDVNFAVNSGSVASGTEIEDADLTEKEIKATVSGQDLTVEIGKAETLRGHWIKVTFDAKISEDVYTKLAEKIAKIEAGEEGADADDASIGWKKITAVEEDRKPANVGNDPVTGGAAEHAGVANNASYTIEVGGNHPGYSDTSNTVTVKPETTTVKATKAWQNADGTPADWPTGDDAPESVTVNVYGAPEVDANGDPVLDDNGNQVLTKVDTLTITEDDATGKATIETSKALPKLSDVTYTVEEVAIPDYSQVGDVAGAGTEDEPYTFTNKKKSSTLIVEKKTVDDKEGSFEFKIKAWTEVDTWNVESEESITATTINSSEIPGSDATEQSIGRGPGLIFDPNVLLLAASADPARSIEGAYTAPEDGTYRFTYTYSPADDDPDKDMQLSADNTRVSKGSESAEDYTINGNAITFQMDLQASDKVSVVILLPTSATTEGTKATLKVEKKADTPTKQFINLTQYSDKLVAGDEANEYKATLKNGESITIPELPAGCHYEVSEITPTGWQLVSVDGDENKTSAEGTLVEDEETKVTFLNKKDEEPEIAKYVEKDVHANIEYFDKSFTYDILAYITKDADSAVITDEVDAALVPDLDTVVVYDLGEGDADFAVNTGSVARGEAFSEELTEATQTDVAPSGNGFTVTIGNAEQLRGHWVKVTFDAKISEDVYTKLAEKIAKIEAGEENADADDASIGWKKVTAVEEDRKPANVGNEPVTGGEAAHAGVANTASYTIKVGGNESKYEDTSNTVTVEPKLTEIEVKKEWQNADGSPLTPWPSGVTATVKLLKDGQVVKDENDAEVTLTLDEQNQTGSFKNLPKLENAEYGVEETPTTVNGTPYMASQHTDETTGVVTITNKPEEPKLEKYVNKDVTWDFDNFDQVFTYDIMAYVTNDADTLTVTDTLNSMLEFANPANLKITDMGTSNDSKTTVAGNGEKEIALTDAKTAKAESGQVEVVIEDLEAKGLRGHWVRVSYDAQIKSTSYATVAQLVKDRATEPVDPAGDMATVNNMAWVNITNNGSVDIQTGHDGVPNKAHYELTVGNDGKHELDSNTVTIEPKITKVEVSKEWLVGNTAVTWPTGATVEVKLTATGLAEGLTLASILPDGYQTSKILQTTAQSATFENLPMLEGVTYSVEEGEVTNQGDYTIGAVEAVEGQEGVFKITNSKAPEEPKIEKYVNKATDTGTDKDGGVHTDLAAFDQEFTYDIQAYITTDATYVEITDDLVDALEIVGDVTIGYKAGEGTNGKEAPLLSKAIEKPITDAAIEKGEGNQHLKITLGSTDENAQVLPYAGKWVQVTFNAQIKEGYRSVDKIKGVQGIWTTIEKIDDTNPNAPIDDATTDPDQNAMVPGESSITKHSGIVNDASYRINLGADNEWKYKQDSNKVTVKPTVEDLTITKKWEGDTADDRPDEATFKAALKVQSVKGETVADMDPQPTATITVNENNTWTATWSDLPTLADTSYQVAETQLAGYDAPTGSPAANGGTITNKKTDVTDTSVVIKGTKVLANATGNRQSRELAADDFEFALYEVDSADAAVAEGAEPIQTAKNAADGTFAFGAITYTEADAGTHYYVVKELVGSDETVALTDPDPNERRVTVTVTKSGYTMTTNVEGGELTVGPFTNTYTQPEGTPVEYTITAKKAVENMTLANDDKSYTFELREGSNLIETVTNNGENVAFKAIKYAKAGTHTYTVTEKKGTDATIGYDGSTKKVEVEVALNDDNPDETFFYINSVKVNDQTVATSGTSVDAGTFTNSKGQVEKYINQDVDATLKNPKEVFTYDVIGYVASDATKVTITDTLVNALEFVDASGQPAANGTATVQAVKAQEANNHQIGGTVTLPGTAIDAYVAVIDEQNPQKLTVVVDDANELAKLQGKWVQVTFNARIKADYANEAAVKADPDFKVIPSNGTVTGGATNHDGLTNKAEYTVELPNNGTVTDESNTVTVEPTYTKLDIEKKWQDAAGADLAAAEIPADDVTVEVLADGQSMTPKKTVALKASESWKATVEGLPEYALDENGRVPESAQKIAYTISEVSAITGFTSTVEGTTVINKKGEQPEIEKYVNKQGITGAPKDGNVHTDLSAFDEVFTYDIQAYITNDATYAVITDTLNAALDFVAVKGVVVKDGEGANGSTAPKLSKEGQSIMGQPGVQVTPLGQTLTVTLGNEEATELLPYHGKWVQITFDAKIKDNLRSIDALKKAGANVWEKVTENAPIDDPAKVDQSFSGATRDSHEGIVNDAEYTINKVAGVDVDNQWQYTDKSNKVTVQPKTTTVSATKAWQDEKGAVANWPDDVESVTVNVWGAEPAEGEEAVPADTLTITKDAETGKATVETSKELPVLKDVTYTVDEVAIPGYSEVGEVTGTGTEADPYIFTNKKNGGPQIEKYVNDDVHQNLVEFDKAIKYDILAYVPNDADEIVIKDTLVDALEFADNTGAKSTDKNVVVTSIVAKAANDHTVNGTVKGTDGTALGNAADATITGQNLEVKVADAQPYRGQWIQVTFWAKYTQETIDAATVGDSRAVTGNGAVLGGARTHTGTTNQASYDIRVGNEWTRDTKSNTVTVEPETEQLSATKEWKNADGSAAAWPSDVDEVSINVLKGTEVVDTIKLTAAKPTNTSKKLPKLVGVTYALDEVTVPGYNTTKDGTTFTNTKTPDEAPEIEKYVEKDVHVDLVNYDKPFVYDVVAYVPTDATAITITDRLDPKLEFVSSAQDIAASAVAIDKSNHKATSVEVAQGEQRSVEAEGTPVAATATIGEGQLLTVVVDNIGAGEGQKNIGGKSVRITFTAQIKANADGTYTLLADDDLKPVTDDKPVESALDGDAGHKAGDHKGIANQASYTITTENDADGEPKYPETPSNEVTVVPESVTYAGAKSWTGTEGNAWPADVKSVTFNLVKVKGSQRTVVDTKTLTKEAPSANFAEQPKLEGVAYVVEEVAIDGYTIADTNVSEPDADGVVTTTITNQPDTPEVEKYVNNDVTYDFTNFDQTFEYEIMAYVTNDGEVLTVTDELNQSLEFVGGKDNVHAYLMGATNNHATDVAANPVKEITPSKVDIQNKKLEVEFNPATDYRGQWIKVTFQARITPDAYADVAAKIAAKATQEGAADEDGVWANVDDNLSVLIDTAHDGVPNKAGYSLQTTNHGTHELSTNTVTVEPKTTQVTVNKVWLVDGQAAAWPEGAQVGVSLVAEGLPQGTTLASILPRNYQTSQTLTSSEAATFANLPCLDGVAYKVVEGAVTGADEFTKGTAVEGEPGVFTITNSRTTPAQVQITKKWANAKPSEVLTVDAFKGYLKLFDGDTDVTTKFAANLTVEATDAFTYTATWANLPQGNYRVEEAPIAGWTAQADGTVITNTKTREEVPEIEKYVAQDVHKGITLDETFTYDIIAWVTNDADTVVVSDRLDPVLAFAGDESSVVVTDLGADNNHKTNGAFTGEDAAATVAQDGTKVNATPVIKGQDLTVTIDDATANRGHWVKVSFPAKVAEGKTLADVKAAYGTVLATATEEGRTAPNVGNAPVDSAKDHTGVPNTASYSIYLKHAVMNEDGTPKTDDEGNTVTELDEEPTYGDKSNTVTVRPTEEFEVLISKTDLGGTEIEGATIVVTDESGKQIDEWTSTTAAHQLTLEPGTYVMEETVAPEGYQQVTTKITFTVDDRGNVKLVTTEVDGDGAITAEDNHLFLADAPEKTFPVKITKADITSGGELPGAVIKVTDSQGNEVDTWTSANQPHELTLKPGRYTMEEVNAPEGYDAITTTITFDVDNDGKVSLVGAYENIGGKIEVKDTDHLVLSDMPSATLSAQAARIHKAWDDAGNLVARATVTFKAQYSTDGGTTWFDAPVPTVDITAQQAGTDGIWIAEFTGLPARINGQPAVYRAVEISTPEGYGNAEAVGTDDGFNATNTVNDNKRGVLISKQAVGGGAELPGARIQIIDASGNVVEEWISTTEPRLVRLPDGTYTLREITAPNGYEVAEDMQFKVENGATYVMQNGQWVDAEDHVVMFDAPTPKADDKETPKNPDNPTPAPRTSTTTKTTPTTTASTVRGTTPAKTADDVAAVAGVLALAAAAGLAGAAYSLRRRREQL